MKKNNLVGFLFYLIFIVPVTLIFAFAFGIQVLYMLIETHFNFITYITNSYYREVFGSTFISLIIYCSMFFYFSFMSIKTINETWKILGELNDKEENDTL